MTDPFSLLGIDPEDQLTDDEVRAAWRRIAAATHPDRSDGGDPERFAAAAAAYTELRTRYGRNEARAALGEPARAPARESARAGRRPGRQPSRAQPTRAQPSTTRAVAGLPARVRSGRPTRAVAGLPARVRGGRPVRLALRVAVAALAATFGMLAAGGGPAGPALAVGAATCLLLTGRQDLGPR